MLAGVIATVRLAPLPPKAMPEFGTSVVFDDVPATVSDPADVSASATVNAIGPLEPLALIETGAMALIVGAALAADGVVAVAVAV